MKKKILVINPNSSEQMTNYINYTSKLHVDSEYDIHVIKLDSAPTVLESFTDYVISGNLMIELIKENKIDIDDYDGILIACFGDPCLFALKELCNIPVVGVAEAAISTALLLGYKFSIIASSEKAKPMMDSLVMSYGLSKRMSSVESLEIPINDFIDNKELLQEKFSTVTGICKTKGAEVIIMGCSGMTMLDENYIESLEIPIIDPITSGIEQLKSLIASNYKISKMGLYK